MKTIETAQPLFPHWMRGFLLITAVYNIAWGAFIYWFPDNFYEWVTKLDDAAPSILYWQGRAVIIMGIAYFASALYPKKFWYLVVIGIVTKIAGGIWFYLVILESNVEKTGLFHLIMNDAIWIPLLAIVAIKAYKIRNES